MENKIKVTKLDAAKRQLETAIRLYFNSADTVSIHTLACAAHEILANINKKQCGFPMIVSAAAVKKEYQKEFMRAIRTPQNFFKHADNDSEKTIVFRPEVTQHFIFDATSKYQELTGEIVPYFVIFRGWFMAHHINAFQYSEEEKSKILEAMNEYNNDRAGYFANLLSVSGHLNK